jgi:predicted esterase
MTTVAAAHPAAGRLCRAAAAVILLSGASTLTPASVAAAQGAEQLRDQLAIGYLQLELSLAERPVTDEAARIRLNREFDRLTLVFFTGNMPAAIAILDTLVSSTAGGDAGRLGALRAGATQRLTALTAARQVETVGSTQVRYLLHLPPGQPPATGWPVVVAVHGTGGDERMFFGGYGAGSIRALADSAGVAVVTPAAPLSTDAMLGLLDAIGPTHKLDVRRVALVGHSMGAGIVARAAAERPSRVAAVACLAGSCAAAAAEGATMPVWVSAGALDPLAGAAGLEQQMPALRRNGRVAEFRRHDTEGHTLVVGEALPEVMRWLARQLRAP